MLVRYRGQSLVEYSVVIGLVTIASLGTLVMLGNNLTNTLSGIQEGFISGLPTTTTGTQALTGFPSTPRPPSTGGNGAGLGGVIPAPNQGQTQLCFDGSSGLCVNVPRISRDGATVNETAGGLGGDLIKSYANVFDQILAQLDRPGQATPLDPQLKDLITQLSNSGHTLGDQLNATAAICQAQEASGTCSVDGSKMMQDTVLSKLFLDQAGEVQPNTVLNQFNGAYTLLRNYLNDPEKAKNLPPEAKALIDFQVEEINTIHGGVYSPDRMIHASVNMVNPKTTNVAELRQQSDATHEGANEVCSNGGDTNQCVR